MTDPRRLSPLIPVGRLNDPPGGSSSACLTLRGAEMNETKKKTPTTDQLRIRIDRGETGDKVAASDPAAAPLGTDAEAGGFPPTEQERALAARRPAGKSPAPRKKR